MRKVLHSVEEVSYRFPTSSIKFQRHKLHKMANFDRNRAFPDS